MTFPIDQLLDTDDPLIGFVTIQRQPDGGLTVMNHRVNTEAPTAHEFMTALRALADAIELEGLAE